MLNKKTFLSSRKNGDSRNWKGKLLNIPCFVLGNGPSLNDFDIKILKPYFTLGINRAFYKIDPTVLMWQDASLWFTERRKLLETKAIKFTTIHGDPENRFYHYKIKAGNFELPQNLSLLYGSGCTGPLAVQAAYLLGCNPIVLCGFDCRSRGGESDFYGNNKYHTENTYLNCRKGLEWIQETFQNKSQRIINCGDNDIFIKENVRDVVKSLDIKHSKFREYYLQYLK